MSDDRFKFKVGFCVFAENDEIILVDANHPNPLDAAINRFSCEVFSLKEKAVREGLIKLGWTPPSDSKED